MKTKNKETAVIITGIILLIVIIALCFIVTESHLKDVQRGTELCNVLNGTSDFNAFGVTCYGIDKEGYKFYWHINDKGEYYKTK